MKKSEEEQKAGGLPPAFLVQTYPVYEGSVPERSFQEIYFVDYKMQKKNFI